ncbi:MAG: hypothetical protein H0W02_18425 [Ktedonobacteraceae bacterium]|nr:hypothetical protein [Ktedonobacteraceae bacterium]
MNIQHYVLRLYPCAWRERYEEEVLAMLEQRSLSCTDGLNLLFGAFDAQLHPHLGTTGMSLYERIVHMFSTLRRSLLASFCAYVGFILTGLAFQKMTEYDDFQAAARASSVVGLSYNLVVIGAVVALLAVLAGGLPIAMAVIRSARAQKRRSTILLLAVPILAFAVFLGIVLILGSLGSPGAHPVPVWQIFLQRGLFFGTLIIAAIVSAGSVCLAVARSEIPAKLLRFALLPSMLATISMALVLAATIVWGLGLRTSAPQLFTGNDGIVGSSTTGTWLAIVIAMAIAAGLSAVSLIRGFSARSALGIASA